MTTPKTRHEHAADDIGPAADGQRRGGRAPDANPLRRCVGTGETQPQSRLVRFVRGPDGALVPDLLERLPGRGVWVTAERRAVELAVKKGGFARGLKARVSVPDGLADRVEGLLVKRCQDLIGLARKASMAVMGADKVAAEIERQPPGWVLEAADGAGDGRQRVFSRVRTLYGSDTLRVAGALTSAELGMAFGRSHVVHALLKRGRFAKLWARDYVRLTGFREAPEETWLSGRQR